MRQRGHDGTWTTNESVRQAMAEGNRRAENNRNIGVPLVVVGLVGMAPSTCALLAGAGTFLIGAAIKDAGTMEMGAKTFLTSGVVDLVMLGSIVTGSRFLQNG